MIGMIGEKVYVAKRRSNPAIVHCKNNAAVDEDQTPLSSSDTPSPGTIVTCPCCSLEIKLNNHKGFPAGMKFEPTDQQLLQHLEAKVHHKLHSLIDKFILTVDEGDNGIHLIHPEILPGVSKNGQIRHFFHRSSKPYWRSDMKRRKVEANKTEDQWHEIGETRPILIGGEVKGFKKMLVLYSNNGKQSGVEKTNWVRYQYHLLGISSKEEDGKWVVSKVFYVQTQHL